MELLFMRGQIGRGVGGVTFKLWSKLEIDAAEDELIKRYKFDQAILIEAFQPELFKRTVVLSIGVFIVASLLLSPFFGRTFVTLLAAVAAGGFGYWWYNDHRDTIYVKDLLHGRHFHCKSVIELAQKEAWLEQVTSFLRQVMEGAKNWDGTQTIDIPPLPEAEAKYMLLKGL